MLERLLIEESLAEAGGEINNDLDLIWQSKELEVKDKLDSYGYLLTEIDSEEVKLKEIKDQYSTRVKQAQNRLDSLRDKLKVRLHTLSGGETLRGHIYSFHPYVSNRKVITKPELLDDSESYLTIELKGDAWDIIRQALDHFKDDLGKTEEHTYVINSYRVKGSGGKVSELPEGHPAVTTISSPSVRIT